MKEPIGHYYDLGKEEEEMRRRAAEARKRKEFRIEVCVGGDTEPLHEFEDDPGDGSEYARHVREFKSSLLRFVDSAKGKRGVGANSDFFVVENPGEDVSHVGARELGVRRLRRTVKRHPGTGLRYRGIPSHPDQPRPVDDFVHGAKVQMLAHEKGLNVPTVCSIILVEGAERVEDGTEGEYVIPGTEETVVDAVTVMERIPGLTFEQLCDPGLLLRNWEKDHKNGYRIAGFLDEHREDIAAHVADLVRGGHGYLLDWDFDAVSEGVREQVRLMHASDEEFPAILHNDLHAGNVIVRPDGEVFIIDFDLAKVSDAEPGDGTGERLEDYRNPGKSSSEKEVYYLPDDYRPDMEDDASYRPMSAIEQLDLYIAAVRDAVGRYRENPEPGPGKI